MAYYLFVVERSRYLSKLLVPFLKNAVLEFLPQLLICSSLYCNKSVSVQEHNLSNWNVFL